MDLVAIVMMMVMIMMMMIIIISSCFLKRFVAQKIQRDTQGYKIVPSTNLP